MKTELSVYVSSAAKHASMWRRLRDTGTKLPIIATWIDNPVATAVLESKEWELRIEEASRARCTLAYCEEGERASTGIFIEIGAALSHCRPVYVVGLDDCAIVRHRLVHVYPSLDRALPSMHAADKLGYFK